MPLTRHHEPCWGRCPVVLRNPPGLRPYAIHHGVVTAVLSPTVLGVLAGVVFIAGALNGVAGFGFALVGTMTLATAVDPATAVVLMIVPILSVNLSLVRDLSAVQLRSCGRRFRPLLVAGLLGTVVGMVGLDRLPAGPFRIGLGVLALGFVLTAQRVVPIPGVERARERCFVETPGMMAAVGGISGAVFGGTNVGVQLVAYVRSCDLEHGLFVGVVALLFLGFNTVRVGLAWALGLYPDATFFAASVLAAVPAVGGVSIGKGLRRAVSERVRRATVLGLLTVIGGRLVLGGLGVA